jgi:Domain of unknown function (DUF4062)
MSKKLQVFVSSTYTDLLDERQAAVAAVLKSGHIPAGMELFSAGDKSQLQTIHSWIEQSDVYMLILGGRYGTIEADSGLSYTELEFNYAVKLGMPMFSIVISESGLENKVKVKGTTVFETKNGTLLSEFKNRVLAKTSSFFDDTKDIRLAVHESLADFAKNRDLIGWVRGNLVVDTQPLFEEIKKLSEENTKLRAMQTEMERQISKKSATKSDFFDLVKMLTASEITVPGEFSQSRKIEKVNLLSILILKQGSYARGLENSIDISKLNQFLYFSVGEKLATFDLVDYKKVSGVAYSRCALTAKGKQFLLDLALNSLPDNDATDAPSEGCSSSTQASSDNILPVISPVSKNTKAAAKNKGTRK